jgi:hypothetical protein
MERILLRIRQYRGLAACAAAFVLTPTVVLGSHQAASENEVELIPPLVIVRNPPSTADDQRAEQVRSRAERHRFFRAVARHEREEAARQEAARQEAARQAELARQEAARVAAAQAEQAPSQPATGGGGYAIPERIVMCESGGDYRAQNPNSSASGAYQIIDSTWDGYGGYQSAGDAPPHVQDQRAAQLWAGGAGRHHWEC